VPYYMICESTGFVSSERIQKKHLALQQLLKLRKAEPTAGWAVKYVVGRGRPETTFGRGKPRRNDPGAIATHLGEPAASPE
jgi:hypothetical protein